MLIDVSAPRGSGIIHDCRPICYMRLSLVLDP